MLLGIQCKEIRRKPHCFHMHPLYIGIGYINSSETSCEHTEKATEEILKDEVTNSAVLTYGMWWHLAWHPFLSFPKGFRSQPQK